MERGQLARKRPGSGVKIFRAVALIAGKAACAPTIRLEKKQILSQN
jgi:hypothetical protein